MISRLIRWWLARRGFVAVDLYEIAALEAQARFIHKALADLSHFGRETATRL